MVNRISFVIFPHCVDKLIDALISSIASLDKTWYVKGWYFTVHLNIHICFKQIFRKLQNIQRVKNVIRPQLYGFLYFLSWERLMFIEEIVQTLHPSRKNWIYSLTNDVTMYKINDWKPFVKRKGTTNIKNSPLWELLQARTHLGNDTVHW